MTTKDSIVNHHNQSMAATETNQRRRLPRLPPPDPVGGASSDDTPRGENARQRRRTQQRLAREPTPDGRDTISPPAVTNPPLPPRTDPSDEHQTNRRRKARRRTKSSSHVQQEPSLLQGFEDEVIIERSKRSNESVLPDLLLSSSHADGIASKSTPTPRIYFENKKTFSSVNKDTAALRLGNKPGQSPFTLGHDSNYTIQQQTAEVLKRYTIHVAKQTHAAFQRLFLFIHGINSGYALWVCIFAFVFTQSEAATFFTVYRSIALITHLLFYIFIALCIVDILDRLDPVKFNRNVFLQSISLQNSAVALIFYTVAMITNLVMMQTEDCLRMSQYSQNGTNQTCLTSGSVVPLQSDTWKNLTAVRAAFVVAGWLFVSIHVKNDRLSTMIKNTEEKAFYEELNIEQNTVPLVAGITSA